jgi:DNA-binding CsgD family transcriptional regulator
MEARLSALISDSYDAVLDDSALPKVARGLADVAGGCSATITWRQHGVSAGTVGFNGVDACAMRAYESHWWAQDPWVGVGLRHRRMAVVASETLCSADEFELTPFYNEFIRPMATTKSVRCLGSVMQMGARTVIVGVHRERRQGEFNGADSAALTEFLPHLQRLLAIRGRLAQAERSTADTRAVLDALAVPVIRTDRNGRVLFANLEAERLLAEADGLVSGAGRLGAEAPADCARLSAMIQLACGGQGGSLSVARASGRRPLAVIALPMPSRLVVERGEALVFVGDPERRSTSLGERLRALYRLTEAEAEVATALVEGADLRDIGEARGVKLSTLREQMSSILAKTETTRQAQLAALLGRLATLG